MNDTMLHPEIESLDREAMQALQRKKLAAMGERLAASPDWHDHFAQAGMTPRDLAAEDGLANAPTMEKADLRARYPYPMLTVDPSQVTRFFATSGTTGLPVLFGFTEHDLRQVLARQVARGHAGLGEMLAPIGGGGQPFAHGGQLLALQGQHRLPVKRLDFRMQHGVVHRPNPIADPVSRPAGAVGSPALKSLRPRILEAPYP
jgi:hypothetical protein